MNHKIIRTALALLFASLLIAAPRAQQPAPVATTQSQEDRIALYQALLDLTNPWTVMCIAAHPDDEDGTSLIVMRRRFGAHTVSVFSTFGEGGQNAIGPELYEELGAIRARETMAAAEIQGSEPYFLGLKDFGYSKSADEAFRVWGHDEALRRMVLQIRKLRPDVIITNHSVTNNDHGHHQATARLILEAFDAAADPKQFPEQLKDGVTTWQVQRLFVRVFDRRGANGQREPTPVPDGELVTIDPNERDPIRDKIYAEEALQGLQKHATQGPWPKSFADLLRARGGEDGKLPPIRYRLVREAKGAGGLTKESHNFLDGLRLPDEIAKRLQPPTIVGQPLVNFIDERDRVFDTIGTALQDGSFSPGQSLERLSDDSHLNLIGNRTNAALATAGGLKAELIPSSNLVPNDTAEFALTLSNNGNRPARVFTALFRAFQTHKYLDFSGSVRPGGRIETKTRVRVPPQTGLSVPHYQHLYDGQLNGQRFFAFVSAEVAGRHFTLVPVVRADIGPSVEIASVEPSPVVVTPAKAERDPARSGLGVSSSDKSNTLFEVTLVNYQDAPFKGEIKASQDHLAVNLASLQAVNVRLPITRRFIATDFGASGSHAIPNVISFTLTKTASAKVVSTFKVRAIWADAQVAPSLRIGYIRGFDYSLLNALDALGVESKELSVDEVKTADLQKYSAIIVDNRVYESQPELITANQRLLDYAKDGGTLIVFYHKSNEWNPDPKRNRPQLAPYNLVLGDERITDENAPVTFIEPQNPLLNFPNKMSQEDFAGWIQERGLYYPREWDAHYTALLASNDPGEQPLRGGLLVADYGRGHYIYTSMVWYRQLRAGVPGAYRMLANMISYGRPTN